jgi:hypothetical protein
LHVAEVLPNPAEQHERRRRGVGDGEVVDDGFEPREGFFTDVAGGDPPSEFERILLVASESLGRRHHRRWGFGPKSRGLGECLRELGFVCVLFLCVDSGGEFVEPG